MNSISVINIGETKPHVAMAMRFYFFGWPMMIFAGVVLALVAALSLKMKSVIPFASVSAIVLFALHVIHRYLRERLENEEHPIGREASIQEYLATDIVRRLKRRKFVSAGDLLWASIATKRGKFILEEMGISGTEMISTCWNEVNERIDITQFLRYASEQMHELNETRIDANVILFLLFTNIDSCRELLHKADMSDDDLRGLIYWEGFHHRYRVHEPFWKPDAIRSNSSMGRSWVSGYTDALDQLTSEVNALEHESGEKSVVVHKDIVENVLRVLSRGKQKNVLLTGKVGVGKKTLVENIAIGLRSQERAHHQNFTRVLMLHTEKLLSGVGNPDTFMLHALARAQRSGHLILVIRDIALLLRSANANLQAVLMKCLEASNISVIGLADIRDYHTSIKTNPLLDSQFEKIAVEDASDEETMTVLMAHFFSMERRHVHITYKALKSIVELSKRYLSSIGGFPGKAVDVMDDAVMRALETGNAFVTEEHVRDVISMKSKVNVQKVTSGEKERLLNLEQKLKSKIIGQDNAVKAVCSALKRARIDLSERKRPMGTFLFLGPTGVGKTQTAKVLAEEYFGSADAIIRLDMNEYSHEDSVIGIVGSAKSGEEGFLAQRVQDKPFSLILLDEIEKAHPNVLNLFLQILDEGFLNDSRGMKTDFRNTIIIATSNAGALFIRDFVKANRQFDKDQFKSQLLETIIRERMFSPEFVNRFDEVVLFYPLSHEGAADVAMLMLGDIINEVQKRRGFSVKVEEDVIHALVERGYSVEFGAREMRRTITEMIEDYLAEYLLRHDVKRGEEIIIAHGDLKY